MKKPQLHRQHIVIFLLLGALAFMLMFRWANSYLENIHTPTNIGVSFDSNYATHLGLDARKTYGDMLDTLKFRHLRLSANWDEIEDQPGHYDFQNLDYYISEAGKRHAQVILVVGLKTPRWPECKAPSWVDLNKASFPKDQLLKEVAEIVHHYKDNPTVVAWQVENEFQFSFGQCPKRPLDDLFEEIGLVRQLSNKPIVVTDSGEYSTWISGMASSDIFGTTLYRDANFPPFGHFYFPIQPWYYRIRSELVRKFIAQHNYKTIVAELQTEAWADQGLLQTPLEEQMKLMPVETIEQNINFAKQAGFDEIYLWGVEWWYYLAQNGHPEYLQFIHKLNSL